MNLQEQVPLYIPCEDRFCIFREDTSIFFYQLLLSRNFFCAFSLLNPSCPAVSITWLRKYVYIDFTEPHKSIWNRYIHVIVKKLIKFSVFHFRMLLVLRGGKLKCLISQLHMERQLLGYLEIGRYETNYYQPTPAFQIRIAASSLSSNNAGNYLICNRSFPFSVD